MISTSGLDRLLPSDLREALSDFESLSLSLSLSDLTSGGEFGTCWISFSSQRARRDQPTWSQKSIAS